MATSVFADTKEKLYKNKFDVELVVSTLTGGVPTDERVVEGWIKKNLGATNEDLIREMVAKTMVERKVPVDEAVEDAAMTSRLVGFRRDGSRHTVEHSPEDKCAGELFMRDYQVKAMIKEAANIRWPKRRGWGESNKGTKSFFAEHVFVVPERIYLEMDTPHGINQRFVQTWRGAGISYEEYINDAKVHFQVITDYEISKDDWAELWVTAEENGFGASRSQGSGKFVVTKWEMV